MSVLPVVVIGAGPQGLAAAAHLLERGLEPIVLESGTAAASAVAEWGHVRLFSAWPELLDPASMRSVVAELAGDHEAAARVELVLPDTGVCGGAGVFDDPNSAGGGCCVPAVSVPQVFEIGRAAANA